jgi:putative ABC transport system permease protein
MTDDALLQDIRYAGRIICKNPGFAGAAILSIALGIAANTVVFSLLSGIVLTPLDYRNPEQLFGVREIRRTDSVSMFPVNPAHALAWAAECPSLEAVAVLTSSRGQIAAGGDPATLPGARVTHDFFRLLGVEPLVGRTFFVEEEQEGRDHVIVLSESLWRARFNGDPSIVGRSIVVDGRDHEVIGIVHGAFFRAFRTGMQDTPSNARFELFRPLVLEPEERTRWMGNYNYGAIVRVKAGVTAEQALAEINVVQSRFPRLAGADGSLEALLIPAHDLVTGRPLGLWVLAAAVGAVQLIVCVNLANLLLSRIASRRREAAVRTALGASRSRQVRLVLTESVLLSVLGGSLGVVLASWIVQLLSHATALDLPRLDEVRVDATVMWFAVGLTLSTGVVMGSVPAWRLTAGNPQEVLRAGSHTVTEARRGRRVRDALIAVEVGLSAALLLVAGLLIASLNRLLQVDKGFETEHVLTLAVDTAGPLYENPAARDQVFGRVLDNISRIPGVEAAGLITQLPLEGNTWNDPIYLEKDAGPRHPVENRFASPRYFQALNISVLQGRAFDESDRGRGVAVLSESAARLLWPADPNPVGRRFMGEDDAVKTLVGVVADVRATLHDAASAHAYYPYWQRVPGDVTLVVRTRSNPETASGPLRAALQSADPLLPIGPIRPLQDLIEHSVRQRRFQSALVVVFALAALIVASLGIYGVVAHAVTRRRQEIGIRMALGAARARLVGQIVRQGMTPVIAGLAGGIALAVFVGRAIRGLLFGIQPANPATIGLVAVVLLVVATVACVVPARRATGPDTLDALRIE